ncbi:MAG: FAD-dependent oxidoreductase, partial [Gammaproteobacteria bacterium]
EALERPGGNTALSTGSIPGGGTRFQRAAGIDDDPDRMAADLLATAGPHDAEALTRSLARNSAPLVEWLVDAIGARIDIVTEYKHVGHSVARLHAPRSRRGSDLLADLIAAVDRRGVPVALGNRVERLLVDDAGAVAGVEVRGERIAARKVLLACNGYAGDPTLMNELCPETRGASYFGALGSTGDAVRWGRELDAAFGNLGAFQGYAAVADPHGSILSWTTIEKGGILVGANGQRFGDESAGYSGFAVDVMRQGERAWAVYDARIDAIARHEEEYEELVAHGGVAMNADLQALAVRAKLPADALEATVAAYGRSARGESADAFGRESFGLAPLEPPFALARVRPGVFHSQGGLAVDEHARVLRADGTPVPNLYAGGGAAVGISGRAGGGGYASGNGLLTAVGLGWLAARAAAAGLGRSG